MPNLGAIGSNAIFCESFSSFLPILPGAEDDELKKKPGIFRVNEPRMPPQM